eukprot:6645754-Pyramimonas_sp.AAC.1
MKWVQSLSEADRTLLAIYRCGAVTSETRRRTGSSCKHCGHVMPSFKHARAECPRHKILRDELALRHGLPS